MSLRTAANPLSRAINRTPMATRVGAGQRLFSSSTVASRVATYREDESDVLLSPVYVHHVSKTVLQYLQEFRADWLAEQGLDRGLCLNSNGIFVLQFPSRRGFDAGRIWTSYDSSTKQHWLSVSRQKLHGRFLLKGARSSDSTNASTYTTASSEQAEERVKNSVNQLIVALSEMETSRH